MAQDPLAPPVAPDLGAVDRGGRQLIGNPPPVDPRQDFVFNPGAVRYPRYYDGAQYEPYSWDDGAISGLQAALVAAGFLPEGRFIPGVWDPVSAAAYEKALAYANMVGRPVDEVLGRLAAGADASGILRRGGGGGGLGRAPLTDDDIKAIANETAKGVIGRVLREDEAAQFIPAFRGVVAGGTSGRTAAENIIREQVPVEAFGHDVGNVLQVFDQILGGR